MAWKVEFEGSAERELDKLDRDTAQRILRFLHKRVSLHDDDTTVRIVVVRIGNRQDIYH